MSFYQRKEVKDLIAYLRLAINQQDDEGASPGHQLPKTGNWWHDRGQNKRPRPTRRGKPMWEALAASPICRAAPAIPVENFITL